MTFPLVLRSIDVWVESAHLWTFGPGPTLSGGFIVWAARYQLFWWVDQKILQIFHCAEAHTILAGAFPSIFRSFWKLCEPFYVTILILHTWYTSGYPDDPSFMGFPAGTLSILGWISSVWQTESHTKHWVDQLHRIRHLAALHSIIDTQQDERQNLSKGGGARCELTAIHIWCPIVFADILLQLDYLFVGG